jgi:hypothetical protein
MASLRQWRQREGREHASHASAISIASDGVMRARADSSRTGSTWRQPLPTPRSSGSADAAPGLDPGRRRASRQSPPGWATLGPVSRRRTCPAKIAIRCECVECGATLCQGRPRSAGGAPRASPGAVRQRPSKALGAALEGPSSWPCFAARIVIRQRGWRRPGLGRRTEGFAETTL